MNESTTVSYQVWAQASDLISKQVILETVATVSYYVHLGGIDRVRDLVWDQVSSTN